MLKLFISSKKEKGFTLIELLIVAAIIGILIAIAVPNLLGARKSANEANAKKMMQVFRDAETQFYDQDIDGDGVRDFTNNAKTTSTDGLADKKLIDSGTAEAVAGDGGMPAPDTDGGCKPKSNYCIGVDPQDTTTYPQDFGWRAASASYKSGSNEPLVIAVYGDGNIRCASSTKAYNFSGASNTSPGCK